MSYLLDALRKSESQKRSGKAPTIHGHVGEREAGRFPRWLGLTIVLVLPAVLVLAWFGLNSVLREAPGTGRPGTGEPPVMTAEPGPVVSQPGLARSEARPGPDATLASPGEMRSRADAALLLNADRTPVEQYRQEPAGAETSPGPATQTAPAEIPVVNEPVLPQEPAVSALSPEVPQPHEPAPIQVWELPENVHSELMDIRISVMVWADRSEDRFVLINGRRFIEGDELQAGLILEEIVRDGAIFRFRHYRFLVPR